MSSFKAFCFLTIPICLAGCGVMIALEKIIGVDFGVIPFIIWGFLSDMITVGLRSKFNWFKE